MRLFRNPSIKEISGQDVKCDECGSTNITGEAWEFDLENYDCPANVIPFVLCFDCVLKLAIIGAEAAERGR